MAQSTANEKAKSAKQPPVFPTRWQEERHYAGRQLIKAITIVIVLSIILYITHFLSAGFTLLFGFIGLILFLATATYSVGHFVRFLIFKSRGV
ncbi:hypothetical protein CIG75_01185 [Tumebacillus algifaecis]|uniref:Uncharacterized protein n=1 Tax=Tumebacillus algifaecis TaxID=1214604 RepID=A0A223CWR5_9BACL|nr:hypothetical protein [Tumebacillus algifaecis]ASS73726.1 hypothetical protein CIG75_01185 [Tumebacillus algifaecis]